MTKRFLKLVESINVLTKSGALEPEDRQFLQKRLKQLGQAISVKDSKRIEKLISEIAQVLLEKMA